MTSKPFITLIPKTSNHAQKYLIDLPAVGSINPKQYYTTSGEAICKMDVLLQDTKDFLVRLKSLREEMVSLRGGSKWLQVTVNEDSQVICEIKNPKVAKELEG